MLNFNQKSRPPERSLPDLNTSHIKLQRGITAYGWPITAHLNTSHIKLQPGALGPMARFFLSFKYISY